ncbi:hypothetical protein WJX84_001993 [Apatococcus fuscideae]|uniref:Uncharacterized protein n=1 Tax=Apatococcus fuscideae TaxID=2026836 RepID=A0AAW1SNW2_9CHLO
MAEEPSLAPQWLKSGITAAGTAHSRPDEGGETGGRPAAVPSARLSTDGPSRDSFTGRRSSDWSGKASQAVGQVPQPSWDKPSLRAHHRGGAHRNIFEDHASDIFGPSTGGAGKHLHPHHHRAGPSTPSSPYRHNKDTPKDFAKEPEKDYGGAWGVGSHQNSTGHRSAATRPLNVRGPALNGANSDGKAAARGPNQQHQIGLEKDYLPGAAASTAASAIPQATPGAATGPTPTPAASSAPAPVTRMADAITQQQMSSAAAMQQVASERQREEKLLARQAKLIPVAFSGPRPRLGGTSHPGDRSQGSKPSALTGLGPAASSKAMLGAPRGSGPESRGIAAPLAAGARRSGVPEDVPVSSGPTTLTLSHSLPMSDKLGSNGTQGSLARALSDVERNARQPLLSPSKSGPTQTGLGSAAAAAAAVKPPGTPTGLQNKAKERNTFFQSLRRARAPASTSERPSSSSSLSPASSLDAPSLATSGRAETADAPGLSSLSEVVQEQLGGKHTAQNGFHDKAAALKGQCEAHGSTPEEAALLDMLGMTVEELAFMRRLGWTPKPASSMEAEGLTEEEIRSFKEQQQAQPSKAKLPPSAVPAGASIRPRSAPYPCPPLSPWRSANGNGSIHLATLDVGSYGSKLSDSDSDPE